MLHRPRHHLHQLQRICQTYHRLRLCEAVAVYQLANNRGVLLRVIHIQYQRLPFGLQVVCGKQATLVELHEALRMLVTLVVAGLERQ